MAYGKIKADTLVYDNSGSDVEVTLASLGNKADLASPTFTGTVTIPTPTSGDNSTKAASTAFVVSGFTAKPASAGTVAASEVVQVDANKDITGFRNVTLSGDLTVNGTTTTIDSTTLTVEDKNIELGKVDTPTDTTADGGGITLKGATDKEIKWVNSTDKWTFNQGIHVTDGIGIINKNSADTDHTNNSVPAGESGLYTLNSNGTNGTFSSVGVIANNGTSDQSASFVAKCTGSGYSPEIYITQRDGANSQRNSIAINTLGDATFIGAVSDSKGNLRSIPNDTKTSAYTLVASDAGKCIRITTGGVTVPNSVFAEGDAVTIINQSASDQTITAGAGFTLYNSGDGSAGNRTLAGRGMATMMFAASDAAYISGAGLS